MSDKDRTANRSWWARNRRWLLWLLALYVLAMLVLYYVSTIPQNQPMISAVLTWPISGYINGLLRAKSPEGGVRHSWGTQRAELRLDFGP